MDERKIMTLADLLCELQIELLKARNDEVNYPISYLGFVFAMIEEVAIEKGDGPTAKLAGEMYDAVRDTQQGVEWKSNIPTIEEIRAIFPDDQT